MTYYTDSRPPAKDPVTLRQCERILARFMLGRDVRSKLRENNGRRGQRGALVPKTGGRYVPEDMRGPYEAYMERQDSENAMRSVAELLS